MLELKKAGLYIANGKNVSVLVKVVGESPMLDIVRGVLLNDMEKNGTVTVLDRDSIIIQDILMNPKNYIFDLPSVSDAVYKEYSEDTDTSKNLELEDTELEPYIDTYQDYRIMYPDNYIIKMQIYLINKGYSKNQADMIINKIVSYIRLRKL